MEFDARVNKCPLCGGAIHRWASKVRGGREYRYDRCRACGFAFVNPRPTLLALARHYSSPIPAPKSSGEATSPLVAKPAVPANLRDPGEWPTKAVAQLLRLRPAPGRLLDVGAADGAFSLAAIRAGLSVTALEIDPEDLPALAAIAEVQCVRELFERFDAPPESFDYVLMSHVLEHAHDPKHWIEKSAELLRRGGILAIMLPHFDSIYRYIVGTRDPYFIPPDHLNHFNVRSLGRLCRQFGLRPVWHETSSKFPNDVVTKRAPLPKPLAPAVRAATAGVSLILDWGTRTFGIGSVLNFQTRKV